MIVDKEHKVIYLHNPKSGGTFLRELYIEKYGVSEATKWWKPYTILYGTDLGHITYDDLSHFIPDWKEYRIVVMVRNPYNRFYSAFNECVKQLRVGVSVRNGFKLEIIWPKYIFFEVQEWNRLRIIYEILRIYAGIYPQVLLKQVEPEGFSKRIHLLNRFCQNLFLRNKRIPWLNPQSYFWGKEVEIFYYESKSDWGKLFDIFGLSEYQDRLSIAKDYEIPDYMYAMIEELYPEDMELFRKYKKLF